MRLSGNHLRTAVLLAMLYLSVPSYSQIRGGGLMVTPTRVEMDGRTRSTSISLINNSNETSTYRIQTINSRMTELGERQNILGEPGKDELFADKLVKFAPRQVRLKPGEQQTIRVMSRISNSLKKGEYRTGLNFQWIPEPGEPQLKTHSSSNDGLAVNVQFSYGITVPVIIRHGDLSATGRITGLKLLSANEADRNLKITIDREGDRSLYGDLSVFRVKADGKQELINSVRGIAIYVPNQRRIYTMKIPGGKSGTPNDGKEKLRVEYREINENGGQLIAESSINLD
ncbi:MAG: hypothetical protein CVV41_14975 [Candidatus Riflebacteria bacterium HGW-Riflebacteria-1]|jgi:P pilus assembly chaperone PapD|nr:MAG: hypothetical protein CVV41_14975 [Candidatus Riflebacteria bacterium HGW-Riflebacteria-1]